MDEKDKRKLNIDEQIDDLKEKNIKFELYPEEEARKFLTYNNYYFKVKSYAHNYPKYSKVTWQHRYLNLDFAYIVELSVIDTHLRKWIVGACLDLEHVLKTRLINDIANNDEEDGFNIVRKYLESVGYSVLSDLYSHIDKAATSELIKKFKKDEERIPVWSFVETLPFGKFIELYSLYYGIYGGKSYISYLGSIKFLRNAAAHNTCLLNSLRKPYGVKINKNMDIMDRLSKAKKFKTSYKTKMENPVVHDFVVLLFVYWDILQSPSNRRMREKGFADLKELFYVRMKRNKEYFVKNDVLVENYSFICSIIEYLENHNQVLRK